MTSGLRVLPCRENTVGNKIRGLKSKELSHWELQSGSRKSELHNLKSIGPYSLNHPSNLSKWVLLVQMPESMGECLTQASAWESQIHHS